RIYLDDFAVEAVDGEQIAIWRLIQRQRPLQHTVPGDGRPGAGAVLARQSVGNGINRIGDSVGDVKRAVFERQAGRADHEDVLVGAFVVAVADHRLLGDRRTIL